MPSPASSPTKQHSQSHSVTKRSTVSGAFKNISAMPDVVGAHSVNSQQSAGTEASRGANLIVNSQASKRISVASVGTMVNPQATAAELLATKSPSVFKTSATSSPPPPPSAHTADTAAIVMGPAQAPTPPSQYTASAIAQHLSASQRSSPPAPPSAQPSTSGPQPSQGFVASGQHSNRGGTSALISGVPLASNVGHGMVDVTFKKAAIFELVFSLLGFGIFLAFSVFMFTTRCLFDDGWATYIKSGALAGMLASIFIMLHSCFERASLGRGIFGCFVFFLVTIVVLTNLGFAFIAMNCICSCVNGNNAFRQGSTTDQTIFLLALAGSCCLIAVLLISSVSHR